MGWPSSSRRQSGVTVVAQLWHATTISPSMDDGAWASGYSTSMSSEAVVGLACRASAANDWASGVGLGDVRIAVLVMVVVVFATRLLCAGQPSQPGPPPAPLQLPPPGQEPAECSGGR